MSFVRHVALALLGLAALLAARPAAAQSPGPPYNATDLGTLGGDLAFPSWMSSAYIVGGSLTSFNNEHAFRWDSTNGMVQLNGLGGENLVAFGINAQGNVVGLSYYSDHTTEHAVAWLKGKVVNLGTLPSGDYSEAFSANSSNMIVGNSNITSSYTYHAFLWQIVNGKGTLTDLGLLPGGSYSLLNAINDNGQAAGSADTVIGTGAAAVAGEHAVLWDSVNGLQDLGTLGGRNSVAKAINNSGQVVGSSDTATGAQHAFLWDSVNGMQDLGTLPGYDSTIALTINANGQVTGEAYDSATQTRSGFVWDSVNGIRDINNLVAPGLGFHLSDVVNNDLGWLSAVGDDGSGHQPVFLLQPQ